MIVSFRGFVACVYTLCCPWNLQFGDSETELEGSSFVTFLMRTYINSKRDYNKINKRRPRSGYVVSVAEFVFVCPGELGINKEMEDFLLVIQRRK